METKLDRKWIDEYKRRASFSTLTFLKVNTRYLKSQEDDFISEKINNPKLIYHRLSDFDFKEWRNRLEELLERILKEEKNELVKEAYKGRIEERLETLALLEATHKGDDPKFMCLSEKLFGSLDEDVLAQSLFNVRENIKRRLRSKNKKVRSETENFIKYLETEFSVTPRNIFPHSHDQEKIRNGKKSHLGPEDIKREVEAAFDKLGIKNDWKAVVGDYLNISVNYAEKELRIPRIRKADHREMVGLIAHEVGTHILRRINGRKSPLALLGSGLDYHSSAEEGLAMHREFEASGVERRLGVMDFAAALAMGFQTKPHSFREVYNVLKQYYFVGNSLPDIAAREQRAHDKAWRQTVRVFRGTSGRNKGYCFTRNLIYHQGLINIRKILEKGEITEEQMLLGKFDPGNEEHLRILRGLGIL